ncbi:MAG: hypothetical protein U5L11_16575 [Arhodomonas sp.]|nr:hypothetical protein [Arhodomonas sp.]
MERLKALLGHGDGHLDLRAHLRYGSLGMLVTREFANNHVKPEIILHERRFVTAVCGGLPWP